jgi:hypothetical protein
MAGARARSTSGTEGVESLCIACGLGLILFDSGNASSPNFSIRVRAARTEPDMFYVNRNLKLATIDNAIGNGVLPAAPREDACGRCDYSVVCGPYEEERVLRKPSGELQPLVQLRGVK